MSDDVRMIAMRLAELRRIEGLSDDELARDLGISKEEYLSVESGERDIPVSLLYKAAGRFNIELHELLSGQAPRLSVYQVVKGGRGMPVKRNSQYGYRHLAYNFARKRAEAFEVTVEPVDDSQPIKTNVHEGQEFNYCLEGEILLQIDKAKIVLSEGDSVYFDSAFPHGMRALGGRTARFLAIIF